MIRARTRARRVARSTTLLKAPAAGVAISQRKLWKRQQLVMGSQNHLS